MYGISEFLRAQEDLKNRSTLITEIRRLRQELAAHQADQPESLMAKLDKAKDRELANQKKHESIVADLNSVSTAIENAMQAYFDRVPPHVKESTAMHSFGYKLRKAVQRIAWIRNRLT
jgi:hypothetical protein